MLLHHTRAIIDHSGGDLLAEAMLGALADVARQLRNEFPETYAMVDEIKSNPDRKPPLQAATHSIENDKLYQWQECLWCGDDFLAVVKSGRGWQRTCSHSCGARYYRWKKKRGKNGT